MSRTVGVAVVGVGFVGGQAHVPIFKKVEGSQLIALCAKTETRVKPLAEKYGIPYYTNLDRMLENPKVEAVVVAVPTPYHFEVAMKAIKKGKHVLCEMPLATNIDQAKQLQKAAEEAHVILMPILQFRFAPIYTHTKEIIESGTLGKPLAFHFREFIPAISLAQQWPRSSWAWDIEKSGGYPNYTLSVWSIDMFRWLFNAEITEINWLGNYPVFKNIGGILGYNTIGSLKLTNNTIGSLHYSASVTPSASTTRLEIYGDNTNVLHAVWNDTIILYNHEDTPKEQTLEVKGTAVWGHRQLGQHFINCILNREPPKVTVEDAIKAQEIAHKMVARVPET